MIQVIIVSSQNLWYSLIIILINNHTKGITIRTHNNKTKNIISVFVDDANENRNLFKIIPYIFDSKNAKYKF